MNKCHVLVDSIEFKDQKRGEDGRMLFAGTVEMQAVSAQVRVRLSVPFENQTSLDEAVQAALRDLQSWDHAVADAAGAAASLSRKE